MPRALEEPAIRATGRIFGVLQRQMGRARTGSGCFQPNGIAALLSAIFERLWHVCRWTRAGSPKALNTAFFGFWESGIIKNHS